MGNLLTGFEVLQYVYRRLSEDYHIKEVILPEKTTLLIGKAEGKDGTPWYLDYQRFGVFHFQERMFWILGIGESKTQHANESYAGDLIGIKVNTNEIPPERLAVALRRCTHLRQSLVQAQSSGILCFESGLSSKIARGMKEILPSYLAKREEKREDRSEFGDFKFKYRKRIKDQHRGERKLIDQLAEIIEEALRSIQ